MWNNLIEFFKTEKFFFQKLGKRFSEKYPKIATSLQLSGNESSDTEMQRLIDATCFLTSILQQEVKSSYRYLSSGILQMIYPNLIQPIPAMSVASFSSDGDYDPDTCFFDIGTLLRTDVENNEKNCFFQTSYALTVLPLKLTQASLFPPTHYDTLQTHGEIISVLQLDLITSLKNLFFLKDQKIRFYLSGDATVTSVLYEMIFCNTLQIAVLDNNGSLITLPQSSLSDVGFRENQTILPRSKNTHLAYQLIQEYFCFPSKFLFFEIDLLTAFQENHAIFENTSQLQLLFLLKEKPNITIEPSQFLLNCTPIINLYPDMIEPISIDPKKYDYLLQPKQKEHRQIHSIASVSLSEDGVTEHVDIKPFYDPSLQFKDSNTPYWTINRKMNYSKEHESSDVWISFHHLKSIQKNLSNTQRSYLKCFCTNGNKASYISVNQSMVFEEDIQDIQIACLHKPTSYIQPQLGGDSLYQLISSLNLSHLSLSNEPGALENLKQILRLYQFSTHYQSINEQQLQGLQKINTKLVVRHHGLDAWRGFHQGLEISVFLDSSFFVGSSAYLFGNLLQHFFALHVSIHSFTETVLYSTHNENKEWIRFPKKTGLRPLL